MKKILILLFSTLLIITSCAPNQPQERPQVENPPMKVEDGNRDLEEDKSAIFSLGDIENLRILTNTEVKTGAGNTFNSIGTLKKDDIVDALDKLGDWYVIRMDNNQVGAIDSNNAIPIIKDGPRTNIQENPQIQQGEETNVPQEPLGAPQPNAAPDATPEGENNQVQAPSPKREATDLPQNNLQALSGEEQQMVDLINQARRENSLPVLKVDLEVARVAEIKAQDMVDNNYFAHNSPTYGSPFDMLRNFGVKFLASGENLAGTRDVQRAHTNLMNSSGHRKNILHPEFTHVGIGVKPSPRYGKIYVQMFIKK